MTTGLNLPDLTTGPQNISN